MTKTETSFVWRPITCWQPAERKQIETAILEHVAFPCLLWLLEISQAVQPNMRLPYNDIIKTEFKNREKECKTDTSCIQAQQDELLHNKYSTWSLQTLWVMGIWIQQNSITLSQLTAAFFCSLVIRWKCTLWLRKLIFRSLSSFHSFGTDRLCGCFSGQF